MSRGRTADATTDAAMTGRPVLPEPGALSALVDRLAGISRDAVAVGIHGTAQQRRIAQLDEHLGRHIVPRARSLDAPLVVLIVGPTGAGKSSLFNALAGRSVSRTGVLRPTTREIVVRARPADLSRLMEEGGALAGIPPDRIEPVADAGAGVGVAVVDAPDVDSVEHANRELTDRLVEAADLAVFVTTASRYADRVPWDVLRRIEERGLPLIVVANRMPADPEEMAIVLDDLRRLLEAAGLGRTELELVGVAEGALDERVDGLATAALGPLPERIDRLGTDAAARRALAERALAGSLAGLEPHLRAIGDDLEHAAIDADRLRRLSTDAFERELGALRDELARGSFIRAEAVRQWHDFVGSDEITRRFSGGIGRFRSGVASLFRGAPEVSVGEVREQALVDLRLLARLRVGEAARRAAAAWADEPAATEALASDPDAWAPSADLDDRLEERLAAWAESIAADVSATGASKRTLARGATLGVNVAGIGVMLATFSQTGGLTGAEMGVAAATAFLNQKLLGALFGEAALVEMIGRARARLMETLGATFREELARFDRLAPEPRRLRELAIEIRAAADELRALPPSVPADAQPVMLREPAEAGR
jgi:energy-coupling factor transporter ATP-binding protein EcfA2